MMLRRFVVLCVFGGLCQSVHGQLILNEDLGAFTLGDSVNISGTTVGAGDEAAYYEGFTNTAGNWGEEFVYQFSIDTNVAYQITTNAVSGDPDFFILNSLDIGNDGVKDFAAGTLQADFLDGAPPLAGSPLLITPGIYYVAVDTWHGVDGSIAPQDSTWDATITFSDPPNVSCLRGFGLSDGFYDREDLNGVLENPYGVQEFTVDTTGSYTINTAWDNFDGFLYLFDSPFAEDDSVAIASDDDGPGGFLVDSEIASVSLTAGQSYYLVGTTFDPMAGVTDLVSLKTTILGPGFATEVGVAIDGDFDDNGIYECADIDSLAAEIVAGTNDPAFDLNGDTVVDLADRDAWLAEAATANGLASPYRLGDANLDGTVDVSDFNIWNNNKFTMTSEWCRGDFTGDGSVDVSDFNTWNTNKFTSSDRTVHPDKIASSDTNPVPEPTALVLFGIGILCLTGKRRS